MEQNFPQLNEYEGMIITITLACGFVFATIKYWIPIIKRYYQNKNANTHISSAIKYNSLVDSKDLFLFNYNLSDITVHSRHVKMSYGRCLKTCSIKKNLQALSLATDDIENIQMATYEITLMPHLTYVNLTINNAIHFKNDYLLPIIQNANKIDSIIYQNGYLSSKSMNTLMELPNLKFLILENILVTDSKAFSIMLFNLKTRQLAYQLKYGIYN